MAALRAAASAAQTESSNMLELGSGIGVTQLGVVCTSYHTLNLTGPSYIWSDNYCFDDEITKVSRTGHRRHRTAVLLPFILKRILRLHSVFSKGAPPKKKSLPSRLL